MFTKSFSTDDFIPGWRGAGALPPRILAFDAPTVVKYLEAWAIRQPDQDSGFQLGVLRSRL